MEDQLDIVKELNSWYFWDHILVAAICGLIGGIGYVLLSGELTPWRPVRDKNYKIVKIVFGSIQEPFIGALSGVVTTLMFYKTIPLHSLAYLSLIAGLGSSAYLKRHIDKQIEKSQTEIKGYMSQHSFDVDESLDDGTKAYGEEGVKAVVGERGKDPSTAKQDGNETSAGTGV
ncbi:hypothetical protein AB6A23_05110 [Paenibacillus tarimensis]